MRCSSSSTRSSCSRSESRPDRPAAGRRGARALAAAFALLVALGGCGDQAGEEASATPGPAPEATGSLRIALADPIEGLDPLLAGSRAEQLASRQIHEPLISTQNGPYGEARRRPGLARSFVASAGDTIWEAKLRSGVRFQDGEPLDAGAVLANVERWQAVAPELVPELSAADNPQPGLVRFLLDRPAPDFPRRLADARLGLIAPRALAAIDREPLLQASGTGAFELRERGRARMLLARNSDWWGGKLGLGPGVAQLELLVVPSGGRRVDQLIAGSVEVADQLDAALAARVEADPLLGVVRGGGAAIGLERSVRGLDSADAAQPLADVWLTDLP